jgi:hypothetical protein
VDRLFFVDSDGLYRTELKGESGYLLTLSPALCERTGSKLFPMMLGQKPSMGVMILEGITCLE